MSGLAQLCGFSRRALYHHFSNKEEAFRHWLEFYGHESIAQGLAAGRAVMEAGGSAVDVIVETMNVRYGDARRRLSRSPHALEINDQAFRRARDIMIGAAVDFQAKVADLLVELEAPPPDQPEARRHARGAGPEPVRRRARHQPGAAADPHRRAAPALSPDDRSHPVRRGVAAHAARQEVAVYQVNVRHHTQSICMTCRKPIFIGWVFQPDRRQNRPSTTRGQAPGAPCAARRSRSPPPTPRSRRWPARRPADSCRSRHG